jgi:hypothetical protein
VSKAKVDQLEAKVVNDHPDKTDAISLRFEKLRKAMQGHAAVVFDIEAEPEHAFTSAIEIADTAVGLLRFYSVAAITPWSQSAMAILGSENMPEATALLFDDQDSFRQRSKALIRPGSLHITNEAFNYMSSVGLAELGQLINEDGLTQFQQALRSSILTFSKGLTLVDVNDRLVHTLSALEGLLLKDENEPIQQNLADRMAFILFQEPQARMDAVKNLKAVYGMRSKYIHHRISLSDEHELETFVRNAYLFLQGTLKRSRNFRTRADFISAIESKKYGR